MFLSKAEAYPGRAPVLKILDFAERVCQWKQSSLFVWSISDVDKKFCDITTQGLYYKLERLLLSVSTTLVWYLLARRKTYRMEPLTGLYIIGKLPGSPANIRVGGKWLKVTNTVAHSNTKLLMA